MFHKVPYIAFLIHSKGSRALTAPTASKFFSDDTQIPNTTLDSALNTLLYGLTHKLDQHQLERMEKHGW